MTSRCIDRKRTVADFQRHLAIHGWLEALPAAYKGDTQALCKYLDSDLPLDEQKRRELRDLIYWRVHRKHERGRKRGHVPSQAELKGGITPGDVVGLTRARLQRLRRANGGKVPRGGYKQALADICTRLGDDGENVAIDLEQALNALRRGKKRR
jgi:hypothetical protein